MRKIALYRQLMVALLFKKSVLFRSVSIYVFSSLLSSIVSIALLPVMTRYLDPAEYGSVAMFQAALAVFSALVGLQTAGAAGRKCYDTHVTEAELRDFNGASLLIVIISALAIFAFILPFEKSLSGLVGLKGEYLIGGLVCASANSVTQFCMQQWQITNRAGRYGAMQCLQAAVNAVLSLILVVAFLQGAGGRIGAQIATSIAFSAVAWMFLCRDRLIHFTWRQNDVRELLVFGMPLLPHALGCLMIGVFDRYAVNGILGRDEVGIYMVAVQFALPFGILVMAINNAYVPWLFERLRRNEPHEKRSIVRGTYIYFFVAIVFAFTAFAIGPYAVILVAGERYADAGAIIGWTTLTQSFTGMYMMVTNYIFFSKKTVALSYITVGSGLLHVILIYALTSRYGLAGAASATALAAGSRFFLHMDIGSATASHALVRPPDGSVSEPC